MKGFLFEELNGGASCRTYLIVSPRTRDALIVDPVLELVPSYLQRLGKDSLRLTWTPIRTRTTCPEAGSWRG